MDAIMVRGTPERESKRGYEAASCMLSKATPRPRPRCGHTCVQRGDSAALVGRTAARGEAGASARTCGSAQTSRSGWSSATSSNP